VLRRPRHDRSKSYGWTQRWTIISADAKIEILGEHFLLTEGPVWIQEPAGGYLLFSDCAANVIYKWMAGKPLSVFLEKSGYTGTDTLNVGQQTVSGRLAILLIGSTGLALDPQGRLVITAMADLQSPAKGRGAVDALLIQERDVLGGRRIRNRGEIRADIGQFGIRHDFTGVGRHLSPGPPDIADQSG
jgi:hypothetical protein